MPNITLDASAIGGTIFPGGSTPRISVPSGNPRISVPSIDVGNYLQAGARYIRNIQRSMDLNAPPLAATAGRVVASAALGNGTLTIANQPDVARQLAVRVDPGTAAISGGQVALSYTANDGMAQVDNVSLTTPASTLATTLTSKGVVVLSSAIVTGLVGGASPKIQVDDTNSISMAVDPNFAGFTLEKAYVNGAVNGTTAVNSTAASYTPSTAPDGTRVFSAQFTYSAP